MDCRRVGRKWRGKGEGSQRLLPLDEIMQCLLQIVSARIHQEFLQSDLWSFKSRDQRSILTSRHFCIAPLHSSLEDEQSETFLQQSLIGTEMKARLKWNAIADSLDPWACVPVLLLVPATVYLGASADCACSGRRRDLSLPRRCRTSSPVTNLWEGYGNGYGRHRVRWYGYCKKR